MEHKFELGDTVTLRESEERGIVIGKAEYSYAETHYLIRYKANDGRQVETWWGASAIETGY